VKPEDEWNEIPCFVYTYDCKGGGRCGTEGTGEPDLDEQERAKSVREGVHPSFFEVEKTNSIKELDVSSEKPVRYLHKSGQEFVLPENLENRMNKRWLREVEDHFAQTLRLSPVPLIYEYTEVFRILQESTKLDDSLGFNGDNGQD